eukprot:CAMPEP_0119003742 /NCGR_PEP_ID=MMETSP1176-20130426/739_1 /TAXON_ID=265551 /ORGANISM="Synedropsis recta cf, Strain CCMP1620" /LENGTH=507 /DNA_ID=CAMNT_0006955367 /DNA_START=80 /DNA_END=1603 /DNA_ORIENTATION=+
MKFTSTLPLFLTGLLMPVAPTNGANPVLSIHGSGTTNPSKCYWHIMDQMMGGTKEPLHMTYRAVGSSTGILDFMGDDVDDNGTVAVSVPRNDFGSGDVPVPTADYNTLTSRNIEMVHLPVVLGAISLFHSVPNVPKLNLNSCLIGQIFNRVITDWTHEDIVALNPNIKEQIGSDSYPITVGRRKEGSSSTASFTKYLHLTCDTEWPIEQVGKTVDWNVETKICDGSADMTACIRDIPGTIGYIDAGHGHSEGLVEIELKNKNGKFLSSKEAGRDGIGAAAANADLPSSADMDFSNVELLNQPGDKTWPIVAMSYIYVRKDLSHIPDEADRALLLAFLEALYEPNFINPCQDLFGFTPVPQAVVDLAQEGIAMLGQASGPTFTFEYATNKVGGQLDYVISTKRRSYGEVERSNAVNDVADLTLQNFFLKSEMTDLKAKIAKLDGQVATMSTSSNSNNNNNLRSSGVFGEEFTTTNESQITAALVMASLSIVMWAVAGLYFIYRVFTKQ